MDINNIQALIAQGLITDVASIDPNTAYVAVGVYQPGNRQSGPAGNAYPSYAIPVSEFLSGAGVLTGVQNGLSLAGTLAELGGTLVHTTDVNINGYSMQFSNGVYPILFLDPGKQQVAIGGNNPTGMLDITAVGSGTVGLQLNTASTQDAKIHFRTNNAVAARAQVYVEDVSQTLNVYTVNSDTIFWNGNGLAQTKTLTLFTDTTAKFESNLGVGVTSASNTRLHVKGDANAGTYAVKVDNLAGNPLLYVRNSARVIINGTSSDSPLGIDTAIFTSNLSGYTFQHAANITWLYDANVKMFNAIGADYGTVGTFTSHDFSIRTNNTDRIFINSTGNVGIGTTTPNASALLDLTSTTGSLLVPRMTTTKKNALTPANGMIVYDSTLDKFQGYEAGAWVNLI